MVRLLTSVEQRENVLHEKRMTTHPLLHLVKSNSKSLNAWPIASTVLSRLLFFLMLAFPPA